MRKASEADEEVFLVTVYPEVTTHFIRLRGAAIEQIERQMLPFRKSQEVECEVVRSPWNTAFHGLSHMCARQGAVTRG